ncbi:LicD family-domain-containing protein [Nemania serpens]|nr:LicD family-domain-containing protein [Nemania serpens]
MHALHPLLLFTLAATAVPAVVVTEIVTETVRRIQTSGPIVVHVPAKNKEAKEQQQQHEQLQLKIQQQQQQQQKQQQKQQEKKPHQKQKTKTSAAAPPHEGKYFHEPGWDLESGHYDARYFRGKVPYEQHRPALRYLVRSYLTTFRDLGAETWLAHGSLLGWWWNGRIMPWDYDLDVQVSVATLALLGERYNRSLYEYEYEVDGDEAVLLGVASPESESGSESGSGGSSGRISARDDSGSDGNVNANSDRGTSDGGSGSDIRQGEGGGGPPPPPPTTTTTKIKRTYLLDVNPHYGALTKGNGANIIDARWIDTSTGLFIDITGLRERDPERSPGVWSCKNNHRYRTSDLWPLRRTEFEGVEAWIPYSFDKILADEYGPKSLVNQEWAGHRWMPELKEWVKVPKKKQKKKKKPSAPKKEEHKPTDDKGTEQVIVYEEVIVEV